MERPERESYKPRPEAWTPRMEVPISKDYFALQLEFAEQIAEDTGFPLESILRNYAPMIRKYAFTYDDDGKICPLASTDGTEIVEAAYNAYSKQLSRDPIPYHEENRFGCMFYTYENEKRSVHLHFNNAEHDPKGPLSPDRLPFRRAEMADMMRDVRLKYPNATHVRGQSWLYNLEEYRSIFPESYTKHLGKDESRGSWSRGPIVWGQFLDSDGNVRRDRAELLLERLRAQSKGAYMSDLLAPPLMLPYKVIGAITDFYTEYGIKSNPSSENTSAS